MRYIFAVLVTGIMAVSAAMTTPASANVAAGAATSALADQVKTKGTVEEVGYRRHRGIHFSFGYGYPRYYGYYHRPYRYYRPYYYSDYSPRYYHKRRWRHRHWH